MDERPLTHPTVTDQQALEEFVEALSDLAPGIERDIADLRVRPDDREVIASLFRAVHNIKGDATLCKIDLAILITHPQATFVFRVAGDSMREFGIFDGDNLAVHTTREARNGQIVVARIDDEVTVKRFQRTGNKVQLIAENPDFAPIEINLEEQDLVIEGLSVGVIRR